ncbi:MAG: hypothetical protein EOP93_19135 [Lysobacteraceae bacterium]|nr:MAG: hypothetical protein EOP93_19135 [Xanthomonadaceae bacterium]
MSWDPFQRAVLAELGHVVYRRPSPANGRPAVELDPAMLQRLARAAATEPEALVAMFEDAAMLAVRGDAGAKRALWPRLRALRRGLA